MNHLGPEECPLCWRFDCKCWTASVDTHPKGEDVEQASFMGSAVPKADAQKPIP